MAEDKDKDRDGVEVVQGDDPAPGPDPTGTARTVTRLLRGWQGGDRAALDELVRLVYAELRRLAARYMHRERAGHTLRPTELLSELCVRLIEQGPPSSVDRRHFRAIAARIMRQVLVDSARQRCASKRGRGERPVTFDEVAVAADHPEQLIALHRALIELGKHDERTARAVELRYFSGLTQDEIAQELGVHVNTVAKRLRLGQAWLRSHLVGEAA